LLSLSLSDLTGTSLVKRRERGYFQWVLQAAGLYGYARLICSGSALQSTVNYEISAQSFEMQGFVGNARGQLRGGAAPFQSPV